jgi:hypothetical protein
MNTAIQQPGTDFGASYATVFRIHGTGKYKSISTRCQQTEPILPRQRILLTVKSFLSNQVVGTEYTTVREGVLYPVREICLKGIWNTSTVTLRVVGGDENGSLKSETVKYGRKSQGLGPVKDCAGKGQRHIQKTDPSSRQRGRPTESRT